MKGTTEDELVGWHHRLNGHEFEQASGDGKGQGRLECCSPWGCKESDTTEQLNNTARQVTHKYIHVCTKPEKNRAFSQTAVTLGTHQTCAEYIYSSIITLSNPYHTRFFCSGESKVNEIRPKRPK